METRQFRKNSRRKVYQNLQTALEKVSASHESRDQQRDVNTGGNDNRKL